MPATLAPIAVFAFKRPEHLARTLAALARCSLAAESSVTVFCDGARSHLEKEAVEKTRAIARTQRGFGSLEVVESQVNLGLSQAISNGVGSLCALAGKVIVVEDDLEVAPNFLEFMNDALRRYENEPRVMQVTGYNYPVETGVEEDAFFLNHASCWGWGTWQRAWSEYGQHPEMLEKLRADRALRDRFDMGKSYPYFSMLKKQASGEIDSWGVLWYLTLFKCGGLVLMPKKTLVSNIGQDGSGANADRELYRDELVPFEVKKFPEIREDEKAYRAISAFLRKKSVPWYKRLLRLPA